MIGFKNLGSKEHRRDYYGITEFHDWNYFFNGDSQSNFFTRAVSTPWSNKDKSCRRYQLCNNFYRRYSINPPGLAEGGLTRGGECYRIFCLARKLSTFARCIARSLLLWLAEDLIFLSCYSKACTPPGVNHPRGSRATPWNPLHRPVYVHIAFHYLRDIDKLRL